ncbi:PREDICTED: putative uncharacterized protein DDB_G0290521 [Nicotiana attenuata]|uniref:putative uncharacterized protein DDB_G0290521 n=1 Tax=Nicotiana attenuata TaxID=49451 RepID=UPI000904B5A3|nr:PREDICTED: putative uncharacterized protein DDB_G0290521 [Nicotiana attenuata]
MAENQTTLPTSPEKTLDSSAPSKTPPNISLSTNVETEAPKPDSPSPSVSLTTSSDPSLPLSVENSETPKLDSLLSLSPEIFTEQNKDGEQSETPQAEKVSEGEETQSLVGEGTVVLFENPSPKETTGTLLEGPDPSPEETGQGSSSQVSFDLAPSPHFDVEPLEILAPAMRSSDDEYQDNVSLDALIARRRPVATHDPSPKRPTTRLQANKALESAL